MVVARSDLHASEPLFEENPAPDEGGWGVGHIGWVRLYCKDVVSPSLFCWYSAEGEEKEMARK